MELEIDRRVSCEEGRSGWNRAKQHTFIVAIEEKTGNSFAILTEQS